MPLLNFYTVLLLLLATIYFILFNTINLLLETILIINTILICIGFYFSIKKKIINIDLIYWIFNYLFFIVAVVIQSNEFYFPNRLIVSIDKVIFGQLLILIWNFLFLILINKKNQLIRTSYELNVSKSVSNIYFILSTIFSIYIFKVNGIQYFFGNGSILSENNSQPIHLLVHSMVYGIVFSNFIFLYARRNKREFTSYLSISIALLELVYIINPFNTNRFHIGFVIIFFLWYFYRNSISAYKFSVIFLLGILIIFPLLDTFRYGFNGDLHFSMQDSFDQFNQLHFDAFANFLATIDYASEYSILIGGNLIGSLLFFIPSSVWEAKPEGSGNRIGNYLIENYGLNFNNLSNPLVSEFYLAFGIIGILLGVIMVTTIFNELEKKYKYSLNYEILYGIILSYLFILLRGSLIVAFSSIIGSIFFMIFLPSILAFRQQKENTVTNSTLDWREE